MQSKCHTVIYVEHACIIVFKCHACTHNEIVQGPDGTLDCGLPFFCHGSGPCNLFSYIHHSKADVSLTSLVPVSLIYYNLDTTKHVCCPTLQVMLKRTVLSTMAIDFATTTVL